MRRALLWFLFVAIGCSHSTPPPPPPTSAGPQHTCATASAKLTDVLVTKRHATAETAKQFQTAVEKACTEDAWLPVAIECVDNAPDHEAMQKCGRDHLTEAQMEHVERAAKATHHNDDVPTNNAGSGSLALASIEPDKGDADGGTYVRIKGTDFLGHGVRIAKVYFGTQQGTVVRFASDNELIVEAPGGKPGDQVDVIVRFDPGGELKLPKAFTFVTKH